MCCMWLAGNAGRKIAKNSPSGHHHTTLLGYIFAIKARIDNPKKNLLKQQYLPHMSQYTVNFGLLGAEIVLLVWGHPS